MSRDNLIVVKSIYVILLISSYRQRCAKCKAVLFLLTGRLFTFSPRRGYTLNRSKWNLAWQIEPWVSQSK